MRTLPLISAFLYSVLASAPAISHELLLDRREVLLSDLASLSPKQEAELGKLVLMRMPEGKDRLWLSAERQAELIRRRVPGAVLSPAMQEPVVLRFASPSRSLSSDRNCLLLSVDLPSGEYLTEQSARTTPCRDTKPRLPVHFDYRVSAPMADAPLPAGTYLGSLKLRPGPIFAAQRTAKLRFESGPVAVERDVRFLRPARLGSQALVRTSDGEVLSVPFLPPTPPASRP